MSIGKFKMITNYLSPVSFKVIVERLPNTEFFTQRVTIPSVSTAGVLTPSPIHNLYQTPDRVEFAELDVSFIVDEDMQNYREIFEWMQGLGSPESSNQRKSLEENKYSTTSDISVLIENSSRNSNIRFNFTDCFPIALSGVNLDVTGTDIIYPECNVTFRYNVMTFEKL